MFDVGDGEGIDVGEGLVEEEEGGLGDEGAGDFEAAPLAAGESAGFFFAEMFEVKFVEKSSEALLRFGFGEGRVSRMQRILSSTVRERKTEGSWAR